jgi:gamma-glutamyltranspeptidase
MSLREVLEPAVQLAEEGFPVSMLTADSWENGSSLLKNGPYGDQMLLNGKAPKVIFKISISSQLHVKDGGDNEITKLGTNV